jgi:hypothetical protein
MTCKKTELVRLLPSMASEKRPAGKREREADYERQVSIRLPAEQLTMIDELKRRLGGLGSRANIMREAMGIGLRELMQRYKDKR